VITTTDMQEKLNTKNVIQNKLQRSNQKLDTLYSSTNYRTSRCRTHWNVRDGITHGLLERFPFCSPDFSFDSTLMYTKQREQTTNKTGCQQETEMQLGNSEKERNVMKKPVASQTSSKKNFSQRRIESQLE
jgi:hypothetical protein